MISIPPTWRARIARAALLPLLALLLWSAARPLAAAEFYPISGVSVSTANDYWPAANLIQGPGVGFSAAEPHAQLGSGGTHRWVTDAPGGFPADYIALFGKPVIVVDLGEDRLLAEISTWGYTTGNANGVKRFSLRFATDAEGPSGFGNAVAYAPSFAMILDELPRQSFEFAEAVTARYVELTCDENFYSNGGFGPPGGGDRVGLGEIAFEDRRPPPDPVVRVSGAPDFGVLPANPGAQHIAFTVANDGATQPLEFSATIATGTPGAEFFAVAGGAPAILGAGESAALAVEFDPGAAEGCFYAILEIASNAPLTPSVSLLLTAAVNCDPPELQAPGFSVQSRTFTAPFSLELSTETGGAAIVYTLDGSLPAAGNGLIYRGPVAVAASAQIRAAAIVAGKPPAVATESYARLADDVQGYASPLPILVIDNFGAGGIPDKGWTTGTQTGAGLVQPPRQPASLWIMDRDAEGGAALIGSAPETDSRIGIRARGAFSSTWNPKPYAVEAWKKDADDDRDIAPLGMPEESDWVLYHPHPGYDRTMLYNTFIWELSAQTGRYGTRFRFVDVFVNEDGGDLRLADRRGVYALAEKVKRGGDRIDFDALSEDGATGGWLLGINRMDAEPEEGFPTANGATSPQYFHTAGPNRIQETPPNSPGQGDDIPRQYNAFINFENPNGYEINAAQRAAVEDWFRAFEDVFYDDGAWLDPAAGYRRYVNTGDFIDYFHLLNLAKQGDGLLLSVFPWVSSGERKLHMGPMWDFNNGAYGGATDSPLYFRQDRLWYPRLFADPSYLREHIDRWYALRRGPLADANMHAIIDRQAAEITPALAALEGLGASEWASRLAAMKSWLAQRAAWLDAQWLAPPSLAWDGAALSMAHPAAGAIFYTADGRDPLDGGAQIYAGAFAPAGSATVRARLRTPGGEWSALTELTVIVGAPAAAGDLAISEIMYHPAEPEDGNEFIEVLNIADHAVDLTGVAFTAGIQFAFPPGAALAPGERIVVVEADFGDGTRLANNGERIALSAADGAPILDFRYNDKAPWPRRRTAAASAWSSSRRPRIPTTAIPPTGGAARAAGGNPGASDTAAPFAGNAEADDDGDGIPALAEHAFGTSDQSPNGSPAFVLTPDGGGGSWRIRFPRHAGAEDVSVAVEVSAALGAWESAAATLLEVTGSGEEVWSIDLGQGERFVRLRFTRREG
ncbi:MAG: CotH kinase family protein [Verrucomicrobiales bacterium]